MHKFYEKSPTTFRGFTLVELLIVIVIIAILASITLVSYGNITGRARNSAIESAADSYLKAFQLYKVEHGGYPASPAIMNTDTPAVGAWRAACLGLPSDYPKTDIFKEGQCGNGHDNMNLQQGDVMYAPLLAQELQTEINPLPSTSEAKIDAAIHTRGFIYQTWLLGNQDPNQTVSSGPNTGKISFTVQTQHYTCPQGWTNTVNPVNQPYVSCTIILP